MQPRALLIAAFAAVFVSGCGGNAAVNAGIAGRSTTSAAGTTTTTGGAVNVGAQGAPAAAAVIGIAVMGALIYGAEGSDSIEQRDTLAPSARHVELDETRTVREVDCSKPIEDYSANIKCK